MSDMAIKLEGIAKQYRIGKKQARYKTLRDTLANWAQAPRALFRARTESAPLREPTSFWALSEVSFAINQGEVVGVIGRNGAGKSTLLKILSRITEPTQGYVEIHGRVGSLLEVGTGFHPELTGRENIFLNGTILGMRRAEVRKKFDEIVAFAEVENFIDTPVKHYSSGMYLRLAFAVAAHMETEILLVDEVLAVGDLAFQRKCLNKMGEVSRGGRTVLFVSHSMSAIQRLCSSAVLLEQGRLVAAGTAAAVTELYLQQGRTGELGWERARPPTGEAYFSRVYLGDEFEERIQYVTTASTLRVVAEFVLTAPLKNLQLSIGVLDGNNELIFGSAPQDAAVPAPDTPGHYRATMYLPPEIFLAKNYSIRVALWIPKVGVLESLDALNFMVQESASLANSTPSGRAGLLAIRCGWTIEETPGQPPVENDQASLAQTH